MLRKTTIAMLAFVLLALNWAALHDIIKGDPDVWLEWSFVMGSALLVLFHMARRIRQRG